MCSPPYRTLTCCRTCPYDFTVCLVYPTPHHRIAITDDRRYHDVELMAIPAVEVMPEAIDFQLRKALPLPRSTLLRYDIMVLGSTCACWYLFESIIRFRWPPLILAPVCIRRSRRDRRLRQTPAV